MTICVYLCVYTYIHICTYTYIYIYSLSEIKQEMGHFKPLIVASRFTPAPAHQEVHISCRSPTRGCMYICIYIHMICIYTYIHIHISLTTLPFVENAECIAKWAARLLIDCVLALISAPRRGISSRGESASAYRAEALFYELFYTSGLLGPVLTIPPTRSSSWRLFFA